MARSAERRLLVAFGALYIIVCVFVLFSSFYASAEDWHDVGRFLIRFWPYIGIALGYGLLLPLLSSPAAGLADPATLAWLQVPMYALHQFEEWGFDLTGKAYPFIDAFNNALPPHIRASAGLSPDGTGLLTPAAGFVINTSVIWLSAPFGALMGPQHAMAAAPAWGVITVNIIPHIVMTARAGAYTPGLATAMLLFLPYSIHTARTMLQHKLWTVAGVCAGLLYGVFGHAIIFVLLSNLHKYPASWPVLFTVFTAAVVGLPVVADALQPQCRGQQGAVGSSRNKRD